MSLNPELDRKIGAAMRAIRRRSSLTDAAVAERMGYAPKGKHNINRWERGERSIAAVSLWRYLQAIGASFSDLDHELGIERPGSRRLQEIAQELQLLAES